jgi:hypothetical protein
VHVQDEIVGVVFAAGPFVEAEIALLLDGFGRRAIENRFACLRLQFADVMATQFVFQLGMKPPRSDDGGANGHLKSFLCFF